MSNFNLMNSIPPEYLAGRALTVHCSTHHLDTYRVQLGRTGSRVSSSTVISGVQLGCLLDAISEGARVNGLDAARKAAERFLGEVHA